MTELSERAIILEHALENENNLKMTLDIGNAYQELRRRIIVAFLEKLQHFVRQQLNESQWNLNPELLSNPFKKYAGFFVAKKAWAERYSVGFQADQSDARYLIVGVAKQAESLPSIEGLKQTLDSQIRQGKPSAQWDWYHELKHPYFNWDNKEALIKLYDGSAVTDLGTYLLRIVTLAAPVIDRHVSKMPAYPPNPD